jgi:DNA-directed RNA polymerase specialized sigma24 family protein
MQLHRDHRPRPSGDLPPAQQTVIRVRDVEDYPAEEAHRLLHVSDGNQRVLVHRERPRVRSALERHLDG